MVALLYAALVKMLIIRWEGAHPMIGESSYKPPKNKYRQYTAFDFSLMDDVRELNQYRQHPFSTTDGVVSRIRAISEKQKKLYGFQGGK